MASIKLVSLNIEGSKHLERIIPFLQVQQPEVVCMQELVQADIPRFEELLDAKCHFVCTTRETRNGLLEMVGVGIFSRLAVLSTDTQFYWNCPDDAIYDFTNEHTKRATENMAVISCEVEKDGLIYKICTTHFTWTPKGEADEYQRQDIVTLLNILSTMGEFVIAGDFNAPRGGEIYQKIRAVYNDNIPPHYKTSIDIELHRAGKSRPHELVDKMVDYIFSTPAYSVSDVELISGVSDHMAVVATVSKYTVNS